MDEAEQDQYEAHLKELFDSFDVTGTGSLGEDELTELCHVLHLEEVAPGALQETLLQDGLSRRVRAYTLDGHSCVSQPWKIWTGGSVQGVLGSRGKVEIGTEGKNKVEIIQGKVQR